MEGAAGSGQYYTCPQCLSKYCTLPVECRVCSVAGGAGLLLVSAPLLCRANRHLLPLDAFAERTIAVPLRDAPQTLAQTHSDAETASQTALQTESHTPSQSASVQCYGCGRCIRSLPLALAVPLAVPVALADSTPAEQRERAGEGGRVTVSACGRCGQPFCSLCDVTLHASLESCPGCASAGLHLLSAPSAENSSH